MDIRFGAEYFRGKTALSFSVTVTERLPEVRRLAVASALQYFANLNKQKTIAAGNGFVRVPRRWGHHFEVRQFVQLVARENHYAANNPR